MGEGANRRAGGTAGEIHRRGAEDAEKALVVFGDQQIARSQVRRFAGSPIAVQRNHRGGAEDAEKTLVVFGDQQIARPPVRRFAGLQIADWQIHHKGTKDTKKTLFVSEEQQARLGSVGILWVFEQWSDLLCVLCVSVVSPALRAPCFSLMSPSLRVLRAFVVRMK